MSRTKDEFFLIKLHQIALSFGDPTSPVDRYHIGRAIGQNDKGINAIVNLLAQANFIKKGSGNTVILTPNGLNLVQELQAQYKKIAKLFYPND